MKNLILTYLSGVLLLQSCNTNSIENKKPKYFSVQKWLETKRSNYPTKYNFYSFQDYFRSVLSDSAGCPILQSIFSIDENQLHKFLTANCNTAKSPLLQKINKFNLNDDRDSAIIAIDLNNELGDSIVLLSKGSTYCIEGGYGSGITGRENYLIKVHNRQIIIISELPMGTLKGLKINGDCKISHLIFEDFRRSYNDDSYHHGAVMFELRLFENKIAFSKIVNVRRGEELDYSDKHTYFDEIEKYYFSATELK